MKKLVIAIIALATQTVNAQNIGINTTTPQSTLEVKSSNQATPLPTDGLLIPKIDTFPATNPTAAQNGMMVYLTTDIGSTLKGFYSWDNAATSWKAITPQQSTNYWGLTGNSGTIPGGVHFIGTTDDVDITFKRQNTIAGNIGTSNTSFGWVSMASNTSGGLNTALGNETLRFNSTGGENTAIGSFSLQANNVGIRNTAIGTYAALLNIGGNENVAVGTQSLLSNTYGSDNVAVGKGALFHNKLSNGIVAIGYEALYSNNISGLDGTFNTAIGYRTLSNTTSGNNNTAVGYNALTGNITGSDNTAVGQKALVNNTGNKNTAVGSLALFNNTGGQSNTALGNSAMQNNINGYSNTAMGDRSLANNNSGLENTAMGIYSLNANVSGTRNTALGAYSLTANQISSNNVAVGIQSLENNTDNGNVAVGSKTLQSKTSGIDNVAIGKNAALNLLSGNNNIAIGANTDFAQNSNGSNQLNIANLIFGTGLIGNVSAPTGKIGIGTPGPTNLLEIKSGLADKSGLTFTNLTSFSTPTTGALIGVDAGGEVVRVADNSLNNWSKTGNTGTTPGVNFLGTTDDRDLMFKRNNVLAGNISIFSTAFGAAALSNLPVGSTSYNAAFGTNALLTNSIGTSNSAFGINALRFNGTGSSNTAVGRESATSNTTGSSNTALGANTLYFNSTGDNNTAVGSGALQNNTNGNNTAIGKGALTANNTGYGNSTLGSETMLANTSGSQNVAIGLLALRSNTLGSNNTGIGLNALNFNTGGGGNVALGAEALYNNTTGGNNIAIGYRAGKNNMGTGNNNIAIGANAEVINGAVSDQISIANLIYGIGATGIGNAGSIGIGTNNPTAKLEVAGTIKTTNLQMTAGAFNNAVLKGDASGNTSWVGINTLETDPKIGGQVTNQMPRWNGSQLVNGNICDNGWVGIFNTSPQAPLHIANSSGTTNAGSQQRAYFHVNTGSNIIQDVSGSGGIVVRADGWYWANGGGFLATSDARIKNIIGKTNAEKDLETLSKIEITDYKYKDEISNGSGLQKKVVAQQLKEIYPIAVNASTGIIPDVFEVAKSVIANKSTTTITTNKPHGFVTGDEVKLILNKSGEKIYKVTTINTTSFTINETITENVFVYGKKVNDLLNVDYDALTTLNISATQELKKEIKKLQQQIEDLTKRLKTTETK